jgi:hypothetical protein
MSSETPQETALNIFVSDALLFFPAFAIHLALALTRPAIFLLHCSQVDAHNPAASPGSAAPTARCLPTCQPPSATAAGGSGGGGGSAAAAATAADSASDGAGGAARAASPAAAVYDTGDGGGRLSQVRPGLLLSPPSILRDVLSAPHYATSSTECPYKRQVCLLRGPPHQGGALPPPYALPGPCNLGIL